MTQYKGESYLRRDSEHLETGRDVPQQRARQHDVPEVDGERLAPHAEVADVEHGQLLHTTCTI